MEAGRAVKDCLALLEALEASPPEVSPAIAAEIALRLQDLSPELGEVAQRLVAAAGRVRAQREHTDVPEAWLERVSRLGSSPAIVAVEPVDLLIVAVKPPELQACLVAYGLLDVRPRVVPNSGVLLWSAESQGMSIALSFIGSAGNVVSSIMVSELASLVQPRLAAIVGMAAGLKEKVALGDVVVAEQVVDFGFHRATPTEMLAAPRYYDVPEGLIRSVEVFGLVEPRFEERVLEAAATGVERGFTKSVETLLGAGWCPEIHRGVVLAGSVLLEDGSLPDLRAEINDRVRALEMEGAGFAASAREKGWPWLNVRGIADYGEADRDKDVQFVATAAAAILCEGVARHSLDLA